MSNRPPLSLASTMNRLPSHVPIRLPPPPYIYDDALFKFSLWAIFLSSFALLNLPISPPQIPALRSLIIVYSIIVYAAFVFGICLLSVSLLRGTAPPSPSPSPNRRQSPPGDAVSRLAIWAIALSAGGLFNLPTATTETLFGEVFVMVYGVTMFLIFNIGLVLLCFNLRKQRCPFLLLVPVPGA